MVSTKAWAVPEKILVRFLGALLCGSFHNFYIFVRNMKLIRYQAVDGPHWAILDGGYAFAVVGSPYDEFTAGRRVGKLDELKLLPPCEPGKVVALAYNYKDLVGEKAEYEEPLIFLKSPTSIIAESEPICIPPDVAVVWVEVELAFVLRKQAMNVPKEKASTYILGHTIANDVTAQNVHNRDWHLARSKGLDTFCPTGPFLVTDLETDSLAVTTTVDGKRKQASTTANRILNDSEVLSLVSSYITLEPGDIVLTGTPAGARESVVRPGSSVTLHIEGIGSLSNPVINKEGATSW